MIQKERQRRTQRNRVDELVKEQGQVDEKVQNGHALGTEREGQDLERVRDGKTGECNVVEAKVDEQERHDCTAGRNDFLLRIDGGTGHDDGKRSEHTDSRSEPEEATAQTLRSEGTGNGQQPVVNLQAAVEAGLGGGVRDADAGEDLGEVVRDDAVADPLGEEGDALP